MMKTTVKQINILDKVLDKEYWSYMSERFYYTGHMYHGSPFESDDNCGTCDGARCETCKKVIIPAGIECSVESDELLQIVIDLGMPEDIAQSAVFDDFYNSRKTGLDIHFPTWQEFKEKYPEKYEEVVKAVGKN